MVTLIKASTTDAEIIHTMQLISFKPLLLKYKNYDTNHGNESIHKILNRMKQPNSVYYLIYQDKLLVGAIRIVESEEGKKCRISPIFILPEFQNKKIAQQAMQVAETMHPKASKWMLQTILEEPGNCFLYEKLEYRKTGETTKISENLTIVSYEKDYI